MTIVMWRCEASIQGRSGSQRRKFCCTAAPPFRLAPRPKLLDLGQNRQETPLNPLVSRKEETRRRIVDTAARLFLEKGVDRVGVDEIMRECGLTHGGFYGYFPSKDVLISEACTAALDETAHQWESLARNLADD